MRQILPAAPVPLAGPVQAGTWGADNPGVGEFGVEAFRAHVGPGGREDRRPRVVGVISTSPGQARR